jgi:predicted porin
MKKSLLSLAVLGAFAAPSFAQSSVTVFGIVDAAVSRADNGQSNLSYFNDWQVGRTGRWVMHSAAGSRLGVRGSEDLGGGWRAGFLLDHRFEPDTGSVEPRDGVSFTGGVRSYTAGFWNAQSYVSLSNPFGEVRMGRIATPTFLIGIQSDPWGYDYNLAGFAGYTRGGNIIGAARNAVWYNTPTLAGFTLQLLVGAGEGGASATATNAPNGRNVGAALRYQSGPIWAAFGFNDSDRSDSIKNRTTQVAFTYDFKVVKSFFNYSIGKNNLASNASTKSWLIGAHVPAGPGYLRAGVGRFDPAAGFNTNSIVPGATAATTPNPYAAYPVTLGQNTDKFGVGYVYTLSKRTAATVDYGTAKTETYSRSSGFQAGLKHSF